jgi:hypothetical protein
VVFPCSRKADTGSSTNYYGVTRLPLDLLRQAKSQGLATSVNRVSAAEPGLAKSIAATPGIDSGENDRQ